jgi:uncharacterized protein with FMN-binding domain
MSDNPPNPKAPKQRRPSDLVTFGTAAVLTVYSAGYLRTNDAAQRFAGEAARRDRATLATKGPSVVAIDPPREAVHEERSRRRLPELQRAEAHVEPTGAKAAEPAAAAPVVSTAAQAPPSPAPATRADTSAPARVDTPAPPAAPPPSQQAVAQPPDTASAPPSEKERSGFKDGIYSGWGTSRHGDIQASVEIKDGKIIRAYIAQCLTRYSCSWVSALPPEVVQRQSPEVDVVSGATESSNAFYYAIVEALKQAK